MSTQLDITPLFPGVTVNLEEGPAYDLVSRVAGELRRAGYTSGADAFEAVAAEDCENDDDLLLLVRSTVVVL